jgi:hypothetical protein
MEPGPMPPVLLGIKPALATKIVPATGPSALRALNSGAATASEAPKPMLAAHARHPQLVREALAIAGSHGYVQTLLETAPLVLDHLVSGSANYPGSENLRTLITAGLQAGKLDANRPDKRRLPDPLTAAEVRLLEILPQRLTYLDMASDLHVRSTQ